MGKGQRKLAILQQAEGIGGKDISHYVAPYDFVRYYLS